VSAFVVGVLIYVVARLLDRAGPDERYRCRLCSDCGVHWNGARFVHSTGSVQAPYEPGLWMDPLDNSKGVLTHPALPAGFGER
jgi:hypothetical protein